VPPGPCTIRVYVVEVVGAKVTAPLTVAAPKFDETTVSAAVEVLAVGRRLEV